MSKKSLGFKAHTDVAQAAAYLEAVLAGLKSGTVCVQRGEEYLVVKPAALVEVEVEAKSKKGKESLSLELSWTVVDETVVEEEPEELKISATEPEPVEAEAGEQATA